MDMQARQSGRVEYANFLYCNFIKRQDMHLSAISSVHKRKQYVNFTYYYAYVRKTRQHEPLPFHIVYRLAQTVYRPLKLNVQHAALQ